MRPLGAEIECAAKARDCRVRARYVSERLVALEARLGARVRPVVGRIVEPGDLSRRLKARVEAIIAAGPPPLDAETERRRRYLLTDLLNDLRVWRSPDELIACCARLFQDLADYHLRAGEHWSAKGKAIPVALRRANTAVCTRYCAVGLP